MVKIRFAFGVLGTNHIGVLLPRVSLTLCSVQALFNGSTQTPLQIKP